MSLQEELKAAKQRIAELEEQAKEEQEFPQSGERYWCINGGGVVSSYFWKSEQFDLDRYRVDNIFKTKEQAEFAVEKLKVEAELRKFSRPFDIEGDNWFMSYSENETIFAKSKEPKTQGVIYFESFLQLDKAVKTVGEERIKKYIFGVED